ncbi:MarR family transcriptional regulator [Gordonia oryzae]|uniref:MarR family transcriptional regulator n=1 Tax=Gordonia oryzae TaxID=2487349 RepID=A0A3N4GF03_9ACTN|nr:MarR family transcriptional regulator [Gordonia oryzae]RPA59957.1 MarR family transcriptional regulator [Gordonia oryzae]
MASRLPGRRPTVPALLQMLSASAGPRLALAFADAGLDGIRPAQSLVLMGLIDGGCHASDLATRLGVSRQAVAQAVTALERHEYVSREPDPDDARAKRIHLTGRGRSALRVMRANALAIEDEWREVLGEQRLAGFGDTLDVLLQNARHSRLSAPPD